MTENEGKSVQRWADAQQFKQEPMPPEARKGPVVRLLTATPDPLGVLAAITSLYQGRVVRDLSELSYEDRVQAFRDMQATALNSALESVTFVFLFEGVDRSFTHQLVRGRHAMYVQESLRFAVPEDWAAEIPLPPSLAADPEGVLARVYRRSLTTTEDAYAALVGNGMPAEEARGLLPHAILTRIHWVTNLRELLHVAGLRTCTQAQFVWRQVFAKVAEELRGYRAQPIGGSYGFGPEYEPDAWQFDFLADQIRPVCYQTGKCAFKASFDRACSIRDRVDANERAGRPSSEWSQPYAPCHGGLTEYDPEMRNEDIPREGVVHNGHVDNVLIKPINDIEWAADPSAARVRGAVKGESEGESEGLVG